MAARQSDLLTREAHVSNIQLSSVFTRLDDRTAYRDVLGDGQTVTCSGKAASLQVYRMPDVRLPSGAIVACDGFIMDAQPYTRRVKPGTYPVTLAIAAFDDDERIAFAQFRFAERPAVRWEMALVEGQDVAKLQPGYYFGYGVDSGTGYFTDAPTAEYLQKQFDPEMKFFDRVSGEMEKTYRHTRSWVHVETPRGSAALFTSGFGDGSYASYFGLDESDEAVAIITDFGVLEWLRPV
jgi:hypothetical protein